MTYHIDLLLINLIKVSVMNYCFRANNKPIFTHCLVLGHANCEGLNLLVGALSAFSMRCGKILVIDSNTANVACVSSL